MSKNKALLILLLKYVFIINFLFFLVCLVLIQTNKNPLIANARMPFSFILMPILFFGLDFEIKNYIYGRKVFFAKLFVSNLVLLSMFILLSTTILYYMITAYPELFEDYKAKTVLVLEQALQSDVELLGESAENIAKKKDLLLSVTKTDWLSNEVFKNSIIGVILALLMSIFLSRKKRAI